MSELERLRSRNEAAGLLLLEELKLCLEVEAQLTAALRAYDQEVVGRREEVTRCHTEMGALRAQNVLNAQAFEQLSSGYLERAERAEVEAKCLKALTVGMSVDQLAKTLCDLAYVNGYVLTYKLDKLKQNES